MLVFALRVWGELAAWGVRTEYLANGPPSDYRSHADLTVALSSAVAGFGMRNKSERWQLDVWCTKGGYVVGT
jgi:hypothetical protein